MVTRKRRERKEIRDERWGESKDYEVRRWCVIDYFLRRGLTLGMTARPFKSNRQKNRCPSSESGRALTNNTERHALEKTKRCEKFNFGQGRREGLRVPSQEGLLEHIMHYLFCFVLLKKNSCPEHNDFYRHEGAVLK